jgi:hypothetical protein
MGNKAKRFFSSFSKISFEFCKTFSRFSRELEAVGHWDDMIEGHDKIIFFKIFFKKKESKKMSSNTFMKKIHMEKELGQNQTLTIKGGYKNEIEGKKLNLFFYNVADNKCYKNCVISRVDNTSTDNLAIEIDLQVSEGKNFLKVANLNETFTLTKFKDVQFNYSYLNSKNFINSKHKLGLMALNEVMTCSKEYFKVDDNVTYGQCFAVIPSNYHIAYVNTGGNASVAYNEEFVFYE